MNVAYNEDCVVGMRSLPDSSIDLTITSPPYDNIRTYNGFTFDWQATIKELYRVTKEGGVVVWIVSDQTINGSESGTSFKQALYAKDCGFNLHDTMIWMKDSCAFPEATRYYPVFEYMFVWSKGSPKTFNPIEDRKNKWGGVRRTRHFPQRRWHTSRAFFNLERNNLQRCGLPFQCVGNPNGEEQQKRTSGGLSITACSRPHQKLEQRGRHRFRSVSRKWNDANSCHRTQSSICRVRN